jgi:hypothetical protein
MGPRAPDRGAGDAGVAEEEELPMGETQRREQG